MDQIFRILYIHIFYIEYILGLAGPIHIWNNEIDYTTLIIKEVTVDELLLIIIRSSSSNIRCNIRLRVHAY